MRLNLVLSVAATILTSGNRALECLRAGLVFFCMALEVGGTAEGTAALRASGTSSISDFDKLVL